MTNREPKYQTLLNQLKQRILDGTYEPGSRVPTELEWARTCGVSRITSRKALELAAVQGLVERFARRGTFVRHDARAVLERDRVTARRMIGIIQPDLSDSFGLEFFRTFQTRVQEQGLLTTTGISNDDMSVENRLIKEFLDAGVHALVIKPVHNETFNNQILRLIVDGFPIVLIDRYLRDVSCANVVSNNFQAAYDAMNYLYTLNHRNIGVLSRSIGSTTALLEREKGLMHAVMQSSSRFRPQWFLRDLPDDAETNPDHADEVHDRIRDFLVGNRDLTALFALKHSFVPIVERVAYELGRRIPEDLSIISFDAPRGYANRAKPLTHLKQNEHEMALQALDAVVCAMDDTPDRSARTVAVDLVVGSTTGPAPVLVS